MLRTTLRGAGLGADVLFAPSGQVLATDDSTHGRLWNVTNPDRPKPLSMLPDDPLLFSPDGTTKLGSHGRRWDISIQFILSRFRVCRWATSTA